MQDVTDAEFQTAVIERSMQVPVVIDLWAEWCGPCKTLGPILESAIDATGGQVEGVKVDVDANPGIAQAFQVQSIPAVYAMKDGQPVDGFVGAQPEANVRAFIDRLTPTEADNEVSRLLAVGDETSLRAVLDAEADHPQAIPALAALLIDDGRSDEALELLARIPETAETRHLAALARHGEVGDDVDAQLGELLTRVKTDDDARRQFVDLLEVLGPEDPRTADWRRKLTSALF